MPGQSGFKAGIGILIGDLILVCWLAHTVLVSIAESLVPGRLGMPNVRTEAARHECCHPFRMRFSSMVEGRWAQILPILYRPGELGRYLVENPLNIYYLTRVPRFGGHVNR
jgi:hypothetical protein